MSRFLPSELDAYPMAIKPRILIVDDRENNLLSLRKILEAVDAEVVSALSGEEALALTIEYDFSLAILDVQMPGMDGFELAGYLRGEPNTCDIPIIFVSAVFTEDAHVFRGYEAGAVDFLPKPIQREWLLGKVQVFLELYRQKMRYKSRLKVSDAVQGALVLISYKLNKTSTADSEASVAKCLEILCRYTMADRAYLALCSSGFEQRYSHGWCSENARPRSERLNPLDGAALPWLSRQLGENRLVFIPSVDDLPEHAAAERSVLSSDGVKSTIIVPVVESDCPGGFLAIDWIAQPTPLMDYVVSLIQVAGNMLFGALNKFWGESALRQSEARQQLALLGADLGAWDWDARTNRVDYSERWAEILGYAPGDLEPAFQTWESRIHPDDRADTLEALRNHMDGLTTSYESKHRLRSKCGDWIWVLNRGRVVERNSQGIPLRVCGTHMDITRHKQIEQERLQAELQLQQAQKMESIGLLAGGIAHDFNNHLSIILGSAELVEMGENLMEEQREKIETVIDAAIRASRLTRQLLLFSRKQTVDPRPLNCNEQINASVKLYRRLIGEDISLQFEGASDLPLILADEQQVDQVIANLLINARDAINDKSNSNRTKVITIRSSAVKDLSELPRSLDNRASCYVRIDVCDTGVGMTSEVQRHVFDPFFTTKPAGHGTGLGLSTVLSIIRQSNGHIEVHSDTGQGTVFTTFWPALSPNGELEFVQSQSAPRHSTGVGHELILYVEDDPDLRRIAVQFLSGNGYRVVESGSGEEALGLLSSENLCPDLLITDVVLPGMNGVELSAAARRVDSQLPVLMVSGYTHDILSRILTNEHDFELLDKPFGTQVLLERVGSILAEARNRRGAKLRSFAG